VLVPRFSTELPHRFKDCVVEDPRQADKIRASVKNGVGTVVGGVVESRGGQIEGDVAHSHVGHGGVIQPAERGTTMEQQGIPSLQGVEAEVCAWPCHSAN
jgi:hypothetical protein